MIENDIQEVYFSKEDLQAIVKRLGEQISKDYEGKNLLLVSILKGSVVFMADLMREITVPCEIDFMCVSSYENGTTSTGRTRIIKDLDINLEGKDLLLVEDILDSGRTLNYITNLLKTRNPASIRICTLMDKPERRDPALKDIIKADYFGTYVPDEFVVGYGLDFAEKYRNLPYVGVLKPEIYEKDGSENA